MNIDKISIGKNPPEDINVIIEIPGGSNPVKYEIDKESGALFVDRFIMTSMVYPYHYGFVAHTLSEDGDPCDVLVISDMPVVAGCVIRSRPIGVLLMEDESGFDEKILAVPVDKLHPCYSDIKSYQDLPKVVAERISHFFEQYKALEKNKWVKVKGWEGVDKAKELIQQSIDRAKEGKK
ncbi:MAG: inorganic diphosphatase [Alphaproteobacteria bacterium]|nr:inorganic diphosphatase [Alphaproteobacteria bacterium]